MKRSTVALVAAGASGAAIGLVTVVRGMLHGIEDLVVDRVTLPLRAWPEAKRGYRLAVLGDFHVGGPLSMGRAQRAIDMALAERPDAIALVGDYVNVWQLETPRWVGDSLAALADFEGPVVAVPGNHDYQMGDASLLVPIFQELGIHLLRNERWTADGIEWVGVDSAVEGVADPERAMAGVLGPAICLWHEPDLVEQLPPGCALMLSGHTHGGQGRIFRRFKPVKTYLGRRFVDGFFPDASTPIYVNRGIGTTLFPMRLDVAPEVSLLTLVPAEEG